jgi:hypothetical protein
MAWRKRHRVRVHMVGSEPSIEGFLFGRVNGHIHLVQAELKEAEGRTHEIEGDVFIPTAKVFFYQRLPG